jgi:hypothetical protein
MQAAVHRQRYAYDDTLAARQRQDDDDHDDDRDEDEEGSGKLDPSSPSERDPSELSVAINFTWPAAAAAAAATALPSLPSLFPELPFYKFLCGGCPLCIGASRGATPKVPGKSEETWTLAAGPLVPFGSERSFPIASAMLAWRLDRKRD